jgi:hypothetical protein
VRNRFQGFAFKCSLYRYSAEMEAQVVARGGVFTQDLVKGRCTHLVGP